ncbi:MAG: hypothetical protein COX30_00315 [Candidatus Moranbacteria bacterium CG23_combo_of_CG06-09_8_20_14_all_39_10]|nr:MAG: hypothetical protein COX30_00315 [Candidatus Moranbacteria bacterium CG23_combo_of_CG06-09_8_20_14_all_39_10]
MQKNESKIDRIIRIVLGLVFLLLAFRFTADGLSLAFYILGVIMLVTTITGFCALYKIFGISTNKK